MGPTIRAVKPSGIVKKTGSPPWGQGKSGYLSVDPEKGGISRTFIGTAACVQLKYNTIDPQLVCKTWPKDRPLRWGNFTARINRPTRSTDDGEGQPNSETGHGLCWKTGQESTGSGNLRRLGITPVGPRRKVGRVRIISGPGCVGKVATGGGGKVLKGGRAESKFLGFAGSAVWTSFLPQSETEASHVTAPGRRLSLEF